jgi:hypothetical protein
MRLIQYAKLRSAGFSHFSAVAIAERPVSSASWYFVVSAAAVLVSLATAQSAVGAIEQGKQDVAERARHLVTIDRLEAVVVSCLNHSVINVDGFAFICKAESLEQKL